MGSWQAVAEQLLHTRYGALIAHAAFVSGSRDGAEDLVHDAFVATFSRVRPFPNATAAEAYVRRAIPTVYLDSLRKRKSRERTLDRSFERDAAAPDIDAQVDVQRALATLSPRERACVVLKYYDDCTVAQVAAQLGIADGTVKRYLADASAKLAAKLGTNADEFVEADFIPVLPTGKARR